MSEFDSDKKRPTHRVSFARINGRDEGGKDILGPSREIGSIWPRQGKDGEGILRFDHIPEELRGRNGGVLFVKSLSEEKDQAPTPKKKDFERDR